MIGRSLYLGQGVDLTSLDPEKDAAVLSAWTASPEFFGCFADGYYRLMPEYEMKKKLTEKLKKAEDKRNAYHFGLRKHESDELVGYTAITWILPSHQVGFLHLYLHQEENWQSYGPEALNLVLRFGFMEASLNRLEVAIAADQEMLMKLLEKNGFLREVQRREARFKGGQYQDELVYGLVKADYKKMLVEAE